MEHSRAVWLWGRGGPVSIIVVTALGSCADANSVDEPGELPSGMPIEVAATPELEVGVRGGDPLQEFDRVVTPFWMSNERLVVPLAGFREIRIFDETGNHLATLGGEGEGPGEFREIGSAWAQGEEIEAFDGDLRRVTRFGPGGTLETIQLETTGAAERMAPGTFEGGWLAYGVEEVGADGRDRMGVHSFDESGMHRGVVAQVLGMRRYVHSRGGGPVPLSPWAWITGRGNEVFVSQGSEARLMALDRDGVVLREVTWDVEPTTSPEEALRVVVDSAVSRVPEEDRASYRAVLDEAPAPQLPALAGLIVDELGFVWIRPYEPLRHAAVLGGLGRPGPGGVWRVLSPEGVQVSEVSMPEELEPSQITSDRVVGIRRDDLGVESVQVYRLVRSSRD